MLKENKTIGLVCREIRLENGYTLKELGNKLDRNMKTLSAFEQGRSTNLEILLDYLSLVEPEDQLEILQELLGVNDYENRN